MQAVLRALSIQDKVNTCRSSHLDRTKKGHVGVRAVGPNYALYLGPGGPLPVAQGAIDSYSHRSCNLIEDFEFIVFACYVYHSPCMPQTTSITSTCRPARF